MDVDVLNHIAEDYIPVIASAGADRDGNSYNVNADTAAGKVAAALGAYKAIFLTDVGGWLADPDDPASLVSRTTVAEVGAALDGVAGGMRPKLEACVEAIRGGVSVRPHRRRPPPPFAAARALHRRGHRDDGRRPDSWRRRAAARSRRGT